MTNIIQIDKSRGFTRMDNQLMDGLMAIDLPGRELKVALFIAKATINFQAGAVRIKATDVAKATNLHPDVASRAISHLLKRRVIHRVGGARGDISICDPKEWVYFECPTRTNLSESDKVVRIGSTASRTKTDDSLLYSKKQTPLVTLPSEEITSSPEQLAPAKPDRKAPFGMTQLLADNPHQVPEQLLADWLAQRKAKRAAVTETVWSTVNAELSKCAAQGVDASTAITEALTAGWQGFKASWVIKRLNDSNPPAALPSRHTGFNDRDYHAGLIEREDGSYAF
ncbi:replication protein [Pseudomonas sp. NUPR-001]|uniref:replication protein n=1 Tax=Pseudomonas sp. NUPR-001 TaxID=3416058 RepID=UPI003F98DED4